jgi:hypothetical protein
MKAILIQTEWLFLMLKIDYETNMLLHNTQRYNNNFQQHGVPYYH